MIPYLYKFTTVLQWRSTNSLPLSGLATSRGYPCCLPGTALQHGPPKLQVLSTGRCSPVLLPWLTLPCGKLLEEGSKKAELQQETKLSPLLPAFVQCQKHSRNRSPAGDQACWFPWLCSVLLSSSRDGVEWGNFGSLTPHLPATGEQ